MFRDIPANVQLVDTEKASRFPELLRDGAIWPSPEVLKRRRIVETSETVERAIESTACWCKKIMKDRWVPDDLKQRLLPARSDLAGHDAIRVRYEVDGNGIQLAFTSWAMFLFIRPAVIRGGAPSQEEKKRLVIRVLDEFLNESEKIRAVSMSLVTAHRDGTLEARPVIQKQSLNYWWGLVSWWTDGRVVRLSAGKADGGPTEVPQERDWLSRRD